MSDQHQLTDITIRNELPEVKQRLKNIADNNGQTVSSFMKMKIREILKQYPEHMQQKDEG